MLQFIKNILKGKSVLKFILLILGILLLLWYLAPLAAGILNAGNIVGITASAAMILFACFYDKIPKGVKYSVIAVAAVFIVGAVVPLTYNMAKYANYNDEGGAKTVIVLGCKVNGTAPSKYLYDRCRAAADYLLEHPDTNAVLSGGQGPDEGISEAECMKNTLVQMGVDESRLLLEDKSTSTQENISFSARLIEERNLPKNVIVVTNEFHEYRAKLLCDKNGLGFNSISSRSSFFTFLTFYTRELMGLAKQIVF